jgi:hypothetical protein
MTGNGNDTTYRNGDLGMVYGIEFYLHILRY